MRICAVLTVLALAAPPALAEGDLAVKATELEELVLGSGNTGYGISQTKYDLVTGQAYTLTLKAEGYKECTWEAPEFMESIWLRKIEAGEVELKAAHLSEIAFEGEGEAELYFVPIRPGNFTWRCRGLEKRGMTGTFVVK